jgi:hypothetical protein
VKPRALHKTPGLTSLSALDPATVLASQAVSPASASAPAAPRCGAQRWTDRTLPDRQTLLPARTSTVAALVSVRPPASLPDTRREGVDEDVALAYLETTYGAAITTSELLIGSTAVHA